MKTKVYDIVIIGAGASGLAAAIAAARAGRQPVVLEHMEQAAKKILATGNGKCNYTNANQALDNYYCEDNSFLQTVFSVFSYEDTVRFFRQLGIRPLQKNGTCMYPESEQAVSVRKALLAETERLEIPIRLSVGIRNIHKTDRTTGKGDYTEQVFAIATREGTVYARTCILAAGGKAAKKTGSDGSGYLYAKQLGHTVCKPLPALTALTADFTHWKLPAGVRIGCRAALLINGEEKAAEEGELQITDYGISGIVVFQFSRMASKALGDKKDVAAVFDFKPDLAEWELSEYLRELFSSVYHAHQTVSMGLTGFLPEKMIPVVLKRAGITKDTICAQCSLKQTRGLAQTLKKYEIAITGTKGFDAAQVTAGGVPVSEIHAENMESRLVNGLFFAGEIVDVDAKCGGYNLQWAWSSGYTAGRGAAEAVKKHQEAAAAWTGEKRNDTDLPNKSAVKAQ